MENVIKEARALGAAIQATDCYKNIKKAQEALDANADIQLGMSKIENLQAKYQEEASKESPDQAVLTQIDSDFQAAYKEMAKSPLIAEFETARQELDGMMNQVMEIIYLCVNGEDPETCQPKPHDDCGSCGGSCCGSCGDHC